MTNCEAAPRLDAWDARKPSVVAEKRAARRKPRDRSDDATLDVAGSGEVPKPPFDEQPVVGLDRVWIERAKCQEPNRRAILPPSVASQLLVFAHDHRLRV